MSPQIKRDFRDAVSKMGTSDFQQAIDDYKYEPAGKGDAFAVAVVPDYEPLELFRFVSDNAEALSDIFQRAVDGVAEHNDRQSVAPKKADPADRMELAYYFDEEEFSRRESDWILDEVYRLSPNPDVGKPTPSNKPMTSASLLTSLGLDKYIPAFEENACEPDVLPLLKDGDLKKLGVASSGHRQEILMAIAGRGSSPENPAEETKEAIDAGGSPSMQEEAAQNVSCLLGKIAGLSRSPREMSEIKPEGENNPLPRRIEGADANPSRGKEQSHNPQER